MLMDLCNFLWHWLRKSEYTLGDTLQTNDLGRGGAKCQKHHVNIRNSIIQYANARDESLRASSYGAIALCANAEKPNTLN